MIVAAYSPKECYIFCNSNNKASIRGIEKAGGVMFAKGYKSKFGFYRIQK
jgi:predicted acetyltransferase